MARGTKLAPVKQGLIQALKVQKLSLCATAKTITLSKTVAEISLKGPHHYASKKCAGRPPKLSERDRRAVFHHATIKNQSSFQIADLLSKHVSAQTVRCELQRNDNVKYVKRKVKPKMKPSHIATRYRGLEAASRNALIGTL